MKKTASVYIPHMGCPNDCIFCNQVKISGQKTLLDYEAMREGIMSSISTMKETDTVEIAFFGGSFTAIEKEVQERCLSLANDIAGQIGRQVQIKLSTRPDAIDDEVIERLLRHKVHTVELGVQSMDDEVLRLNNRGHDSKSVYEACKLIRKTNINLGLQLMIGLLGDTKEKLYQTIQKVIDIRPDIARIYPVLVIKDTALERLYHEKKYQPISLEDAVIYAKDMYKSFENANIKVIRIGLQATENIAIGKDMVAGPFHSAFGEMVISEIFRENIEKLIIADNFNQKILSIACPKTMISKIVGNKKKNIIYFKQKYDIDIRPEEGENLIILGRQYEWEEFIKL